VTESFLGTVANNVFLYASGATVHFSTNANGTAIVANVQASSPSVIAATASGGNGTIYVNNSQIAAAGPGPVGPNGPASLTVGSQNGGSNSMRGKLAEVLALSVSASSAVLQQVYRYAGARYALAVT
jgi:hypothetical protein